MLSTPASTERSGSSRRDDEAREVRVVCATWALAWGIKLKSIAKPLDAAAENARSRLRLIGPRIMTPRKPDCLHDRPFRMVRINRSRLPIQIFSSRVTRLQRGRVAVVTLPEFGARLSFPTTGCTHAANSCRRLRPIGLSGHPHRRTKYGARQRMPCDVAGTEPCDARRLSPHRQGRRGHNH